MFKTVHVIPSLQRANRSNAFLTSLTKLVLHSEQHSIISLTQTCFFLKAELRSGAPRICLFGGRCCGGAMVRCCGGAVVRRCGGAGV